MSFEQQRFHPFWISWAAQMKREREREREFLNIIWVGTIHITVQQKAWSQFLRPTAALWQTRPCKKRKKCFFNDKNNCDAGIVKPLLILIKEKEPVWYQVPYYSFTTNASFLPTMLLHTIQTTNRRYWIPLTLKEQRAPLALVFLKTPVKALGL